MGYLFVPIYVLFSSDGILPYSPGWLKFPGISSLSYAGITDVHHKVGPMLTVLFQPYEYGCFVCITSGYHVLSVRKCQEKVPNILGLELLTRLWAILWDQVLLHRTISPAPTALNPACPDRMVTQGLLGDHFQTEKLQSKHMQVLEWIVPCWSGTKRQMTLIQHPMASKLHCRRVCLLCSGGSSCAPVNGSTPA